MLLPLLLIGLASVVAAIIAYGTDPRLAGLAHGLKWIMLSRRLEWPLVTLCLLLCIALIGLIISGRKRSWWLIGLAPILALFVHHYAQWGRSRMFIAEFAPTDQVTSLADEEWVVGIVFEDEPYALRFRDLYVCPVVFITDYDKRMLLMWSAHANRAVAYTVQRDFRARNLEIVSTPIDTLLLYNQRLGQFIVALTAQTPDGQKPAGFVQPIPTTKTTWSAWHQAHPTTKLMQSYARDGAPTKPILPTDPNRLIGDAPGQTPIDLVQTRPLSAVRSDAAGNTPLNLVAGQVRLLIVRDPATRRVRVFDRNVKEDLFPNFVPKTVRRHPEIAMSDPDSNSLWTMDGKAVDGPLKGTQMKELQIEPSLYWGVMKYWYPQLSLAK